MQWIEQFKKFIDDLGVIPEHARMSLNQNLDKMESLKGINRSIAVNAVLNFLSIVQLAYLAEGHKKEVESLFKLYKEIREEEYLLNTKNMAQA